MTRHLHLSVEQLIKSALDGEELVYTTSVVSGGERTTKENKITFSESQEEVKELLTNNPELTFRLYPELKLRTITGEGGPFGKPISEGGDN